jgi:hypothetical protein
MPTQPVRVIALFWFALVALVMIALVGVVTLTADTLVTPSPTPLPTFTFTPLPGNITPTRPTRTHTPQPSGNARVTLTASPTFTPSPATLQCAWQWARNPLPEITRQVQALFTEAKISGSIHAEAYGENCLDYRGGTPSVAYFAAMTTDFSMDIRNVELTDPDALAETYLRAYDLLVDWAEEAELPARPGYLTVRFNGPDYYTTVRAMFSEVQAFLDDGLRGRALLEALGGWPVTPIPQPT